MMLRRFSTAATKWAVDQADTAHSIKQIGVIGAGQMGIGITFVSAVTAKVPVTVLDSSRHQLDKQLKFLGTVFSLKSLHTQSICK